MDLRTINVIRRPTGAANRELLRFAARYSAEFGAIVRSDKVRLQAPALHLLDALQPFVTERRYVNEWPGSRLTGGPTALLYRFALDDTSLNLVLGAADSLYEWVNPHLLEDLHMVRDDGTVVLGCTAQEDDAWLSLFPEELAAFMTEGSKDLQEVVGLESDGQ